MKLNFTINPVVKRLALRFVAGIVSASTIFVVFGGGAWAMDPLIDIKPGYYDFVLRLSLLIGFVVFVFLAFFTSDDDSVQRRAD